ncbi:MAG: T9SS type A sorting domain-containing protein, partial [Saprospiraceae bacterium]
TYTTSGTYTGTTTNCVTEKLVLTITPSTTNTTTASACDTYTWSVNGTTYTASGTYTKVTGCHTETLNLTIIPSTTNTTTASACDTYTWSVNGTTYTSSGTYTKVTGCHTETLVLTVFHVNTNAGADVTINCTTPSATLSALGTGSFLWSNGATTASITVSPNVTTQYSITLTGGNACTSTGEVVVTVDKTAPTANAGADATIDCVNISATLNATGGGTYLWSNGENTAAITVSPSVNTVYIVTVTAQNGCTATDETLVVIDRATFVVTASDDVTLTCANPQATLTATGGLNYLWSTGETSASISVSPNATTNYVVTISGTACVATESVLVTVNKTPVITCPNNLTINTDLNSCFATNVNVGTPVNVYPVCGIVSTAVTFGGSPVSSATAYPVGQNIVQFRVTDAYANSATCAITVNVKDVQKPIISGVPSGATVNCQDAGLIPNEAASVNSVTVSDNCSFTVSCTQVSTQGTNLNACSFYNYTITNTWTATDASGNTATASQVIVVKDDIKPSLTNIPAAVTVSQNFIPTPAVLNASDNCSPVQITVSPDITSSLTKPLCFSVYYLITRTWTASDACGNSTSATQLITVSDQVLLTCPANKTLNTNNDGVNNYNCSTLATAANQLNPVFSDVCDIALLRYSLSGVTTGNGNGSISGVLLNRGATQVTYTAVFNNPVSCTFTVTIVDNEAPKFNASNSAIIVDACDLSTIPPALAISDNCDLTPTLSILSDVTANVSGCATKTALQKYTKLWTRTWLATDISGNTSTSQQKIYLRDMNPPVALCRNFTIVVGNTNVSVNAAMFNNGSFDACSGALTFAVCNANTNSSCTNFASSMIFSRSMIGTASSIIIPIRVRVTDACGNSSFCTANVTLQKATLINNNDTNNNSVITATSTSDAIAKNNSADKTGEIMNCYPNPFTEDLNINYNLTEDAEQVTIKLFDNHGKLIKTLDQGESLTGAYTVRWNLSDLSPGMYHVCLEVNDHCSSLQRVILLK